jgi:hypothetical protein
MLLDGDRVNAELLATTSTRDPGSTLRRSSTTKAARRELSTSRHFLPAVSASCLPPSVFQLSISLASLASQTRALGQESSSESWARKIAA